MMTEGHHHSLKVKTLPYCLSTLTIISFFLINIERPGLPHVYLYQVFFYFIEYTINDFQNTRFQEILIIIFVIFINVFFLYSTIKRKFKLLLIISFLYILFWFFIPIIYEVYLNNTEFYKGSIPFLTIICILIIYNISITNK